jgi:uncharacterized protein (TIGR02596 family)
MKPTHAAQTEPSYPVEQCELAGLASQAGLAAMDELATRTRLAEGSQSRVGRLPRRKQAGFSLVELLVVIAIVAVLAGMTVGSLGLVTRATALTSTAGNVIDQLNLARQQAVAANSPVEVRFYKLPDADFKNNPNFPPTYRAMQVFQVLTTPTNPADPATALKPLGKVVNFGQGVIVAEHQTLSNIMVDTIVPKAPGDRKLLDFEKADYEYKAFRITPTGGVTESGGSPITVNPYFLLYLQRDFAGKPTAADVTATSDKRLKNWFTVQIDSTNGRIRSFRP